MFTKKKNPIPSLTVEAIQDSAVDDNILLSTDEYKELLRKEVVLDMICGIVNDPTAKEELRYSWDTALRLILKHALPEKFVPDKPEPEEDGEEGGPF